MNTEKLKLLLALQEDPVAPAAELAKQVGVTPPTARAWLDSLRDEKVYVSVQANILSRRLGLEMDVLHRTAQSSLMNRRSLPSEGNHPSQVILILKILFNKINNNLVLVSTK